MLTVHHLGKSQSERVVWLCEELGLDYELVRYARDPVTVLAPPELKALHPMGSAPLITDGGPVLAESGAIVEYILAKYGDGRARDRSRSAGVRRLPSLVPLRQWDAPKLAMSRCFYLRRLNLAADNPILLAAEGRRERAFRYVDERLNAVPYLAGDVFTAADIMTAFSLTTMRTFVPVELAPYSGILAYLLQRIGGRKAYRRAMEKGDPGFPPMLA